MKFLERRWERKQKQMIINKIMDKREKIHNIREKIRNQGSIIEIIKESLFINEINEITISEKEFYDKISENTFIKFPLIKIKGLEDDIKNLEYMLDRILNYR
ncbi:MAG: hypothetical protein ACFFG0_08050 [Candidatus Thorarchaeota archaeon]